MKELEFTQSSVIENALRSQKVEQLVQMYYWRDSRAKDFDPTTSTLGLIISVDSEKVVIEGTLSRGSQALSVITSYSEIPALVKNSNVLTIEVCDEDILSLIQSTESDVIELNTPWSGPKGDEWDSPAYDSFWSGAEKYFAEKIRTLEKVGKKVKVV
ncbi:MAG: hypothetical protein UW68_C0017G0018 [Candidatus Collierbacteria bacterium GW2011_GWB1_44_6]|uniref:Uncharacterized protein n=1 Tax=Candidatus Collierbacteria bacterium GW2011_GWB1_44_6 TaxID=1618384 RepID=A0A0G1JP12_9BACT|nr:MAG: hypothetical protein UW68_C0017G0018 [Candidatus Collierbacteria bacterium GW2011_GWB1_44_6]